jgi:hypothetical protein
MPGSPVTASRPNSVGKWADKGQGGPVTEYLLYIGYSSHANDGAACAM